MNKIAFFLAQKILKNTAYNAGLSTMTLVCFAGIFIGTLSLTLVTAIMNGFEYAIHEKMQGIHSSITIDGYGENLDMHALTRVLRNEFPEIVAISPHTTRHVLLKTKGDADHQPAVIVLNGIDPTAEQKTSTLFTKIIAPSNAQHHKFLFDEHHLVIGKQLALNNNIRINDTLDVLYINKNKMKKNSITFDSQPVIVSGIFDTGIDEFDNGVAYCSFTLLEEIFPNTPIERINIKLAPRSNEKTIIEALQKRLGLGVYSWKDLYPSLVAALKIEKYVSFCVIALILLVASMNIISLLYMYITQKRPDIAILQAMGMSHFTIQSIFFIIGATISIIASFSGLLCACIISYCIKQFPCIVLPDTYYVTHIPIALDWHILVAIITVICILSIIAPWLPTRQIKTINISHVLRFEGPS
jgi:lipoprotein-releasing system permease protein